ncbi:MAG: hypothetical protein KBC95_01995 [Candidatus Peribacteraceae bacterium]|nr:hypothetical protein [Candidatus Peribacteraceae bacterium]
MSQFKSLEAIQESLSQTSLRFSWQEVISQFEEIRASGHMSHVIERRLTHVNAAMQITGQEPTLPELIRVIRAQETGSPVRRLLLQVTAAHIAYILVRCAWPHSVSMAVLQEAREYQLFLSEPFAGQEDHSNGIMAELANFAEGWLMTL